MSLSRARALSLFINSFSHWPKKDNGSNFQYGYGQIVWRIELKINTKFWNIFFLIFYFQFKCVVVVVKIHSISNRSTLSTPSLFISFVHFAHISKENSTTRRKKKTARDEWVQKNQNTKWEMTSKRIAKIDPNVCVCCKFESTWLLKVTKRNWKKEQKKGKIRAMICTLPVILRIQCSEMIKER